LPSSIRMSTFSIEDMVIPTSRSIWEYSGMFRDYALLYSTRGEIRYSIFSF
jgi:hypothetical protein